MDGGVTRESPDSSAQSKSSRTLRNFMHGNRETSGASVPARAADRREKAESHIETNPLASDIRYGSVRLGIQEVEQAAINRNSRGLEWRFSTEGQRHGG